MHIEKYNLIDKDLEYWKDIFLKEKALTSSKNTIKIYSHTLNHFIEYAYLERVNNNIKSIREINRYFILGFVNYLQELNLSNTTINDYITNLKVFLKYITQNNIDGVDFVEKMDIKLKRKQKIKEAFSTDEVIKIETALLEKLNSKTKFNRYRNYLMLLILLKTGMRADEILSLKKDDIKSDDINYYSIKIKGKGDKERINFIKKDYFEKYINTYLQLKVDLHISDSDYFFCKKDGKKLTYFALLKFNRKFLESLNIKLTGLHIYRHTFARIKLSQNVNLATISQWLGHSDVSITARYYARANENILKQMAD